MVAIGMISAAYILQADFNRRGMKADASYMITVAGLTGIVASKLYLMIDDPGAFTTPWWPYSQKQLLPAVPRSPIMWTRKAGRVFFSSAIVCTNVPVSRVWNAARPSGDRPAA